MGSVQYLGMEIIKEPLPGLLVLKPKVFSDTRGYFFESFNEQAFKMLGINAPFVQDNQSLSNKGALRGMHFQCPPHAQDKLIRVIKGSVLDVVIDIRVGSPTFGKHFGIELSEDNFLGMYIPKGFAHGFLTLQDHTIFSYKCSDFYFPETEGGILWNDKNLNINWGISDPILSEKDKLHPTLSNLNSPFIYESSK